MSTPIKLFVETPTLVYYYCPRFPSLIYTRHRPELNTIPVYLSKTGAVVPVSMNENYAKEGGIKEDSFCQSEEYKSKDNEEYKERRVKFESKIADLSEEQKEICRISWNAYEAIRTDTVNLTKLVCMPKGYTGV